MEATNQEPIAVVKTKHGVGRVFAGKKDWRANAVEAVTRYAYRINYLERIQKKEKEKDDAA